MSESTEVEKWAKFPATDEEEKYIAYLKTDSVKWSDAIILHLLTELINQRAEISTLKAALNIED